MYKGPDAAMMIDMEKECDYCFPPLEKSSYSMIHKDKSAQAMTSTRPFRSCFGAGKCDG
jgi:hypothetical protein